MQIRNTISKLSIYLIRGSFSFSLFCCVAVVAQPAEPARWILIKKIPGKFKALETDRLGNSYVLNSNGTLIKFNEKGDSIAGFNDIKKYGDPTSIDVSNPMRPLLFYQAYSTIVALDQLLVKRFSIDLRKQNMFNVSLICNSYDNNFWIFDNQQYQLVKIDQQLRIIKETADLRQLLDEVPNPVYMKENGNRLQIYDTSQGWYQFDLYGGYQKRISVGGWRFPSGHNQVNWGIHENKICSIEESILETRCIPVPEWMTTATHLSITFGYVCMTNEEGLWIYKNPLADRE